MGRTVSRTELEAGGGDDFFSIFPGPDFVLCCKSRARLVSSCRLNYFQSSSFTALGRAKGGRGRADEKKKPGLKFNPGLALIGLQTTMKQPDLEQFSSQCALFPPIIIDYGLGSSTVIYLLIEIQSFSCKRRLKLPFHQ